MPTPPPHCPEHGPMARHALNNNLRLRIDGIWWTCTNHHCGRLLLEPTLLYALTASVRATSRKDQT